MIKHQLIRRLILARIAVVTDSLGRTCLTKAERIYYNSIPLSILLCSIIPKIDFLFRQTKQNTLYTLCMYIYICTYIKLIELYNIYYHV